MKWKRECYTVWKFLLINSATSDNKIKVKDKFKRII
jgi:hypothetical protein